MLGIKAMGLVVAALVACVGCASTAADESETESTSEAAFSEQAPVKPEAPANFLKVRDGLYRGGHPSTAGIAYLKSIGVKRIVDLEIADFIEAKPSDIDQELRDAKAAGIEEFRHPMSAFEPAVSPEFDKDQTAITALLATATANDPIYVHCKHGQDRTGLVIGLERVFDEEWTPQAAHDEMVKIGFHTFFAGLEEYFERKTGWDN